jgi:hypothetical protein
MSLEAAQYNEIVTTYADTPMRLKRYDPSGPWDKESGKRTNQAEALRKILSVISDYMAALAVLSADGLVDYETDMYALTDSINNLDAGISSDTIGAVGSLTNSILEAAMKDYRAKQVKKIVEQANEPLQKILKGDLRQVIDRDFRRDLKIEKISINRYYNFHLQTGKPSSAAKVALGEWKELRLEQNARRLAALEAYLIVLDKVAEGHEILYQNRNKLDAKRLIKDLYKLVNEIRKQVNVLVLS